MLTAVKSWAPPSSQIHPSPIDRIGSLVEGQGTAIVMLHSSMSSKHQWRKLMDETRDRHQLIAIDLHGCGETSLPWSTDSLTLDDEVRLVDSVVRTVLQNGERFHLIGHSYGGVVALQLAQRFPQSVRSLTLFEPIPFHLFPKEDDALAEVNSMRSRIEAHLCNHDPCAGAACFIDYWSGKGAFSRMPEDRQEMLSRLVAKANAEFGAVGREPLRGDAYRRIVAPTYLISGSSSPCLAHVASSILTELLPNARRQWIEAGHMAPITDAALVNPMIERFIRSVESEPMSESSGALEPPRIHLIHRDGERA